MSDLRAELIETIKSTRYGLYDDLVVGEKFNQQFIEKIADRILADGWTKENNK